MQSNKPNSCWVVGLSVIEMITIRIVLAGRYAFGLYCRFKWLSLVYREDVMSILPMRMADGWDSILGRADIRWPLEL